MLSEGLRGVGRQFVTDEEYAGFRKIQLTFLRLPQIDLSVLHGGAWGSEGGPLEADCHMVARAFHRAFPDLPLTLVDGQVHLLAGIRGPNWMDHSWLRLGNHIIDLYPPGILGGPIMTIYTEKGMFPLYHMITYDPRIPIDPALKSHPHFEEAVSIIEDIVRKCRVG